MELDKNILTFVKLLNPDLTNEEINEKYEKYLEKNKTDWLIAIEEACKIWGVTYEQFKSRKKTKDIVSARYFFFYWACEVNKCMSLSQIGDKANRDHATVLHGVRTVKNISEFNKHYRIKLEKYLQSISNIK
jgi:chromosomal replication initiation ATPase DnaA